MEDGERLDGVFQKIRLETGGGSLVKVGRIPRFNRLPDVIMWGQRIFTPMRPAASPHAVIMQDNLPIYREAFAVALAMNEDGSPSGGS